MGWVGVQALRLKHRNQLCQTEDFLGQADEGGSGDRAARGPRGQAPTDGSRRHCRKDESTSMAFVTSLEIEVHVSTPSLLSNIISAYGQRCLGMDVASVKKRSLFSWK